MKNIVALLAVCFLGVALGYLARMLVFESRVQTNLLRLGGESLGRLEELSAMTRGFQEEEIETLWTEWKRIERDYPAPDAIAEASRAHYAAIVYREVERVGWDQYRDLIKQNSGQFLGWRWSAEKMGHKITSPALLKRIEAAESEIVRVFPDLQKEANQTLETTR